MDLGGWYDLDTKEWKFLLDIIFVTAMLPPTKVRSQISLRYLKYFHLLQADPLSNESLQHIFGSLLDWHLAEWLLPGLLERKDVYVRATIELYNGVLACKELQPTPARPTYIFSIRDIGKVIQGISRAVPSSCPTLEDFTSLWLHESLRVFADRLMSETDIEQFEKILECKQALLIFYLP